MSTATLGSSMVDYVNAGFSGLWVQTCEPDEAQRSIAVAGKANGWRVIAWDVANGIHGTADGAGDPLAPVKALGSMGSETQSTLLVLHNYHKFLANPEVMQTAFTALIRGKSARTFLVVLAPTVQIPVELEKLFVVLDHELPDRAALRSIATVNLQQPDIGGPALDAAVGLTRYEAEGAFALSLAKHGAVKPDVVWKLKAAALRKSGTLELHKGTERFDTIGGLAAVKDFCIRAMRPGGTVKPRGVMLLGVPGVGKSALCKALGNEVGRPVARAITGNLKSSGYGDSEQRMAQLLKTADAMAPCVLFFDEVEKLLAGASRKGDPGATAGLMGVLMEWLNDHTSEVFVVMTCNDISELPPAFSRAERFDGVFFLDLPPDSDRAAIWAMYRREFGINPADSQPADSLWTGAEIKACCRLSALLGVSLLEASQNVVPVAQTAAESVAELQKWADGRCLDAARGGLYRRNPDPEIKPGRRVVQHGGSGQN